MFITKLSTIAPISSNHKLYKDITILTDFSSCFLPYCIGSVICDYIYCGTAL